MATTLTKVLIHVTFSTKGRVPLIPGALEQDLYAYAGVICRNHASVLLDAGGTEDHVHFLVNLGKTIALSTLMLNVKRDTSKWFHDQHIAFDWQDGYFGFSLGESGVGALRDYLARQKQHHARVSFKEEVLALLRRYGIEADERYMWD